MSGRVATMNEVKIVQQINPLALELDILQFSTPFMYNVNIL